MPRSYRTYYDKKQDRRIARIEGRQELKWKDTLLSGVEMTSDPASTQLVLLNGLSQGDTSITREGNNTTFTSLQFRAEVFSTITNLVATFYRIIIFRDNQPNGAGPLAGNLLDITTITPYIYAPYNLKYAERFKVLYDYSGVINPQVELTVTAGATTEVMAVSHKLKFRKKLSTITNYGLGNAGTVADISKHSFYILLMSDQTDASGLGPSINAGIRMIFKDD